MFVRLLVLCGPTYNTRAWWRIGGNWIERPPYLGHNLHAVPHISVTNTPYLPVIHCVWQEDILIGMHCTVCADSIVSRAGRPLHLFCRCQHLVLVPDLIQCIYCVCYTGSDQCWDWNQSGLHIIIQLHCLINCKASFQEPKTTQLGFLTQERKHTPDEIWLLIAFFVSLWRVWLVKLLSDWLDHPVILILDVLPTIFLPIITHISTLCTYHCVCWGNILHLHICPMECKQKGRRQPHHWLCRRIPYCLRSWVLTWDTSGCKRSIICDSGWPHSLDWVRCEGEGGECSRSQCPQCNHESKDWWWVDWEVIAGCVCWLRQVLSRGLHR